MPDSGGDIYTLATPLLDFGHPTLQLEIQQLRTWAPTPRNFLIAAHRRISRQVCPIYTVDEKQPTSVTWDKGAGSCSQRLALLESFARAAGIGTRVRALWIDGRFWYPRFQPPLRWMIPSRLLLAWPQFWLEEGWVDTDELFASSHELAARAEQPFTNSGETLFEAIEHTAVDFFGKTKSCGLACISTPLDLSGYLREDGGIFDSRDVLFGRLGTFGETPRGLIFERIFGGKFST